MDNPPILNVVTAGTSVPLKWTLLDAAGAPYASMSSLQAITSSQIKCPNESTDPVGVTNVAIGTTGIAGVTNAVFHFNWSTDRRWAGTCRSLTLQLSDGSRPHADFQFK